MKITLAGEAVELLAERALWWPAAATLFVADVHLGKAAHFRALGLPVPSGTTQHNLDRLSALIAQQAAARVVVLGDFLHAATAQRSAVIAPVQAWRDRHAALEIVLVRGNHDRHAGDPPASLGLQVVDEPWLPAAQGPFAACHHPQQIPGRTALAGHWHPAVLLQGRGRDAARLPCFWHVRDLFVLPAFGAFTGASPQGPPAGATVYPVGGGRVWRVDIGRRP